MAKIRSAARSFKPSPIWVLWAALLLPWVAGNDVPLSPGPGEVF